MRFGFDDDQLALRDAVADLLARECPPEAVRAAWDTPSGRVPGLWTRLAAMGVVGLRASAGRGGLGCDEIDLVLLLEEAGRRGAPEPLVEVAAVGVPLLEEIGGDLADAWVPQVAGGTAQLALRLDGSPVADAAHADLLLLVEAGELHAVPGADVRVQRRRSVDGSRRLFDVAWEPTPATAVGLDRAALARARDRGAWATAAVLVGLGAAMLERSVAYVREREQFGRPVGSFQAVKHRLADAALGLEYARPAVHRAAWSLAREEVEVARDVSIAKAVAGEAAHRAGRAALQVHGAIGYTVEYDLHLWLKRTWALAQRWGDAVGHRARVAGRILDGPAEAADWHPEPRRGT